MSATEQAVSFPSAKRRCWDLVIVRKNACNGEASLKPGVEENQVLEAFRKKYTSARKVVFKPATAVDPSLDHGNNKGPDSPCDVKDELEPAAANTTAASSSDGRICVQVEFAGPQPIKGPAEVLCSLLGGVSVTATPVFLARGRRRKRPKTCFVSDMSVEGTAVIADEMACGGVMDTDKTGSSNGSTGCDGDAKVEETPVAAVESGATTTAMLPETTSWETMPLWHLAPAPVEMATAEECLLTWGDIPYRATCGEQEEDGGGTFICPSPTEGLSTSPSSMSLLSGFRSSSSGLSTWEDFDCDTGMPEQEAPARLFETAFEASDRHASHLFSPPEEDSAAGAGVLAAGCLRRVDTSDSCPSVGDRDYRDRTTSSSSSTSSSGGSTSLEQPGRARSDSCVATPATDGSINCVGKNGDRKIQRITNASLACDAAPSGVAATTFRPPAASGEGGGPGDEAWGWWTMRGESRGWRRTAETVEFGWMRQEFDFDGRPSVPAKPPQEANLSTKSNSSVSSITGDNPCCFALKGVDRTSHKPRDLAVHARFSASPTGNVVHSVATPLEVNGDGDADVTKCTVQYPSLEEMWPEMYGVRQILVIEVDMVVEVRSSEGKLLFTGPSLKVTYRRAKTGSSGAPQSQQCTRVSSRNVLSDCFGRRRRGVYPGAATCVGTCQSPKDNGECSCCTGRVVIGSPSSSSVGPMVMPPEDSFAALLI